MEEVWKEVIGFGGNYMISDNGKVYSRPRMGSKNNFLNGHITDKGYHQYCLRSHKSKLMFTHVLVALHFVPNPENKPHVNHIDGNKLNNHFSNLEWVTPSENNIHAIRMGLRNKQRKKQKFASREEVLKIRELYPTTSQVKLSQMFSISRHSIQRIGTGISYKHIQ